MWLFGHLGLGSQIARPLGKKLPLAWILIGTLLPDLIDKPLYYVIKPLFGFELISCSRTFGHTAILIIFFALLSWILHSRAIAGLSLGMATHILLDGVADSILGLPMHESSAALAALYPIYKTHFAAMPFDTFGDHLKSGSAPVVWVAEIVGAFLLFREWRRRRYGLQKKYFASKKTAL